MKREAIRGSWGLCVRWGGGGGGRRRNDGWPWVSATPWISSPAPFPLCLSPSVLHSPLPISLPHSLYLSLLPSLPLLTQRSCQCLLLLIQVSNPPPVKDGGKGQAEPLEKEFIRVAQSVITPVPLSLLLATTSLPCHRATDCSCRSHTHKHTTSERAVCSTALSVCFAISECMCFAPMSIVFCTVRINKASFHQGPIG